ncbi:putative zf-parp-type zinc finger protein [Phaeomoniella chlamydospora]|uniref:Putative zf-parp-type zinc finger protein n=1 Tax=Phaeomoniella chlamydospora TaxID=158046 RepID=A0A0G2E5T8_PHACM|nr:putative zf-parp-type zinc finger protein [Phaeomoniella chlamydospora]
MPTYRFELAKSKRSICTNKGCKDARINIDKGDLRFGVLVTINDHDSWRWKHWNCVTPDQWGHINKYLEEAGGIDYLDGYDEVDDLSRERIQKCLQDGKVPDEDWRHDVELNVPGGRRKATPKKKKAAEGDEIEPNGADATPTKPKKAPAPKKQTKKKRKAESETPEPELDSDGSASPAPPPKKSRAKRAKKEEDSGGVPALARPAKKSRAKKVKEEEPEDIPPPPPPTKTSRSKKVKAEEDADNIEDEVEQAPKKKSKAKAPAKTKNTKVKPEPQEDSDAPLATAVDEAGEEDIEPQNEEETLKTVKAKKEGKKAANTKAKRGSKAS